MGPQLAAPQLAALQAGQLLRLDDSSTHVRVGACAALGAWLPCALGEAAGRRADADAASLASTLLLHMDDPDDAVAEAACAAMLRLAALRPGAVRPVAETAAGQRRQSQEHDALVVRVLTACNP